MERYNLKRTGEAPLRFDGELIASADGSYQGDRDQNRWHEINIYQTKGKQYVVSVIYHSCWVAEGRQYFVDVVTSPAEVATTLATYDPLRGVAELRSAPGLALNWNRQLALDELASRYKELVTEVLDERFAEVMC